MQKEIVLGRRLYFISFTILLAVVVLFAATFALIRHFDQPFSTGSVLFLRVGVGLIAALLVAFFVILKKKNWIIGTWWNVIGVFVILLMGMAVFALQWFMLANHL